MHTPCNNLLKFADFVREKGCECQGRGNEDSNSYFREDTRIYHKCNILLFHIAQKFPGRTLFSSNPLLLSMADFQK